MGKRTDPIHTRRRNTRRSVPGASRAVRNRLWTAGACHACPIDTRPAVPIVAGGDRIGDAAIAALVGVDGNARPLVAGAADAGLAGVRAQRWRTRAAFVDGGGRAGHPVAAPRRAGVARAASARARKIADAEHAASAGTTLAAEGMVVEVPQVLPSRPADRRVASLTVVPRVARSVRIAHAIDHAPGVALP